MTFTQWAKDKPVGPKGSHGYLMIQAAWEDGAVAEREACAKAVEARGKKTKNGEWHGNNQAAAAFAECIRARATS